jgi:hypothetical protein
MRFPSSQKKYHDTRSPRRFQKRQEDMDERLSGGRLNAYLPTPFEDGMQSMRLHYRLQIFRGPSPSEFGFEGSRTSTKAFGYSCYPDSDTESTHLEENSVRF